MVKALSLSLVMLLACTNPDKRDTAYKTTESDTVKAVALIHPLGNSNVNGIVTFEKTSTGVKISAEIENLSSKKHGFHIHEYGDCSSIDGTSAGGHFNPLNMQHSSPDSENRHMGDMGNLENDQDNPLTSMSYIDNKIQLSHILGRGVIVHAGEDDFNSQPSGAAGERIACGVIGISK